MEVQFVFWFFILLGILYFGIKRYFDKKSERFEDRDN